MLISADHCKLFGFYFDCDEKLLEKEVRNYISKQETMAFADGLNVGLRER